MAPLQGFDLNSYSVAYKSQNRKKQHKYFRIEGSGNSGYLSDFDEIFLSFNLALGNEKRKQAKSDEKLQLTRGNIFGLNSFLIYDEIFISSLFYSPYISLNYRLNRNFNLQFEYRPRISVNGTFYYDWLIFPSIHIFQPDNFFVGISYQFR